jgi:hypothetical protein
MAAHVRHRARLSDAFEFVLSLTRHARGTTSSRRENEKIAPLIAFCAAHF